MKISYQEFLSTLIDCFEVRRLQDHVQESHRSICLLRHDVDADLSRALRMAQVEEQMGVRATYFMLHTASYYRQKGFCKKCMQLQDAGHEVGLHNDLLTERLLVGTPPSRSLSRELNYLRSCGLTVNGTSAHGNSLCRKYGYINYEIFERCSPSYRPTRSSFEGIKLHTLQLQKYGLYEAYFLPRDYYITDCRKTWRYIKGGSDEWHPEFQGQSPVVDAIQEFLRKISKKRIILQALIHPSPSLIEV